MICFKLSYYRKYLRETFKYLLRSYPVIRKYVKEIDGYYEMSPAQLKERNNKRFLEMLHIAYNKTSFYRKLYDDAGIDINEIRSVKDIDKLPIITKDMVRRYADEMITMPKWMYVKAHTSGTTGTPLMVYETWPSLWREQATGHSYRKRLGVVQGKDVEASLRGNLSAHETVMWVGVSRTLYLSSYNLRLDTTEEYYKAILRRKPKSIEGYPSSLYTFACNLETKGFECHIPICFTSSEILLDYQRAKIEKVLNTQIYDIFGTTERTIKLVEYFDHSGYFEVPGYSINEYLEDGEITTSLINDGFPMIRYRGNDIINFESGSIKSIGGRAAACIYGKDGTTYSSSALTYILKGDFPIKYAQFVQNGDTSVDLNIVPNSGDLDKKDTVNLLKLIDEKIGLQNIDIRINIVEEKDIIYTSRGKFNYIVNNYKK